MGTQVLSKWRAALNVALMDDVLRANTLTGIEKVAPQSVLLQIPTIAASYAALTAKGATLATAVANAAASEQQHKANVGVRAFARYAFDGELVALKTLVEHNATTPGDITGMGFLLLSLIKASKTPPDPPGVLLVRYGKVRGKAAVAVPGKGYQGSFAAEMSTDPIGVWTALPGHGKERKFSGYASGAKIWVHMATERWGLLSAWSAPVLVTFP